jgi:hypothetical protein
MKQIILIGIALGLSIYGWSELRKDTLTPANAPRWNPFALKESGFGRTLARVLTEQANASYHHGLLERKPPISTNPLSNWLNAGNTALGFQGRLKYRPIEQYPLHAYEVKQALEQVEKDLRLAFELDPGNYAAYDVYFFFLTNEVTQTEFASMAGAQLKDDDDDEADAAPGADTPGPGNGAATPAAADLAKKEPGEPPSALQQWAAQERQRRQTRAIEITDEAIRKFRPNTMDPERFLSAAVMWYNRFMLLAPGPDERQKSAEARREFAEVGPPALTKMTFYINEAKACQQRLERTGLWQVIPERRGEFLRLLQLIDKCADTLSVALQHNRSELDPDQSVPSVWGPLGKNR